MTQVRLFPVNSFGQLMLQGKDALGFLHNQLTAPVKQLEIGQAQAAALCQSNGRTLATVLVWRRQASIKLITRKSLLMPVKEHLQRFVLRADVGLSIDDAVLHGSWSESPGPGALLWPFPPARWITDSFSEREEDQKRAEAWAQADILSGIAWLEAETSAQFLPQELGLDQVDALVYDKGCYPGQEIVARVHYLGRAKKGLVLAQCTEALVAGTIIEDTEGDRAGTVLNCAADPELEGAFLIQAVLACPLQADAGLQTGSVPLLVTSADTN